MLDEECRQIHDPNELLRILREAAASFSKFQKKHADDARVISPTFFKSIAVAGQGESYYYLTRDGSDIRLGRGAHSGLTEDATDFWAPLVPLAKHLMVSGGSAPSCDGDACEGHYNGSDVPCRPSVGAAWLAFPVSHRETLTWQYFVAHQFDCPRAFSFRALIPYARQDAGRKEMLITTDVVAPDDRLALDHGLHVTTHECLSGKAPDKLPVLSVAAFRRAFRAAEYEPSYGELRAQKDHLFVELRKLADQERRDESRGKRDQGSGHIHLHLDAWANMLKACQPGHYWEWLTAEPEGCVIDIEKNPDRFLKYLIWVELLGPGWTDLYTFPLFSLQHGKPASAILCLRRPLEADEITLVQTLASTMFSALAVADVRQLNSEKDRYARWAGSAAIMARNMSHNVGSHVLANLGTGQAVTKAAGGLVDSDEELEDGLDAAQEALEGRAQLDELKERLDAAQEALECTAQLNTYLRTRMDFLADVATQASSLTVPMLLYRDLVYPFLPARYDHRGHQQGEKLLLTWISGVRAMAGKITLRLQVNGTNVSLYEMGKAGYGGPGDVSVGLPSGKMGAQALYIIIENVIRNSVKHAGPNATEPLELTLKVDTDVAGPWRNSKQLIRLTIHDNRDNCVQVREESDGLPAHVVGVAQANESIAAAGFFLSDGRLNRQGWGRREMKIAAAYLRGKLPSQVDDGDLNIMDAETGEPPLLKTVLVPRVSEQDGQSTSGRGDLGYEFYVQRPRRLLILDIEGTGGEPLVSETTANELTGAGIFYVRKAKRELAAEFRTQPIDHEIVLVVGSDDEPHTLLGLEESRAAGPIRWVRASDLDPNWGDFCKALQGTLEEIPDAIVQVWDAWVREAFPLAEGQHRRVVYGESGRVAAWDGVERIEYGTECVGAGILADDKLSVVYERHGTDENHGASLDAAREGRFTFWEPFGNEDPTYAVINYPPPGRYDKESQVLRLIEAAVTKVTIVDERIQKAAQQLDRGIPVGDILSFMQVQVPGLPPGDNARTLPKTRARTTVDLDFPTASTSEDRIRLLEDYLKDELVAGSHFLVIHQGIIDKLGLRNRGPAEAWLAGLRQGQYGFKHIVVDSGRGVPDGIPEYTRYVALSNLQHWSVEAKSKFHLCQLLYSARGPQNDR